MPDSARRSVKAVLATIVGGALFAAPLIGVASSASASVDGTGVVINEVYTKGGSANAFFNKKFVELYNPGDVAVSLDGWSLQYRPAFPGPAFLRLSVSSACPAFARSAVRRRKCRQQKTRWVSSGFLVLENES